VARDGVLLTESVAGPLRKLGLAFGVTAVFAIAALSVAPTLAVACAPSSDQATVSLAALPPEARQTEQLIRRGGPFAHAKDGTTFGNRERHLPRQPRGYWREYTVKTPGARDRGARRIVCGGSAPTAPEACYYTGDHYASFKRIVH
jgi:ribonuclease T1